MKAGDSTHVRGLDMLRFLCASSVVLAHLGAPPVLQGVGKESLLGKITHLGLGAAFPGAPAVIVFFLVSGFCIHYPYRSGSGRPLHFMSFYARRLLRIYPPLWIAAWGTEAMGVDVGPTLGVVIWSVWCEMFYYLAYPGMRWIAARVGWAGLTLVAWIVSAALLVWHPQNEFMNLPLWQATLVGLPSWLLGALLGERFTLQSESCVTQKRVLMMRGLVYLGAVSATVLRFHGGVGFPWSTLCLGVLMFFWLRVELEWWRRNEPPRVLEKAGEWSYSLYLVHFPVAGLCEKLGFGSRDGWLDWGLRVGGAFIAAYIFFLLVERPARQLAKWVGKFADHRLKAA
jgi:peptidoglycan/LPS O-acetylase OafA/YrhL